MTNELIKKLLFGTLLLVSVVVYIFAPQKYNYGYCMLCTIFFIAACVLFFLSKKQKNVLTFESLFLIISFFAYFVYPTFIYPINPHYFWMFSFEFNHDVISKSTAIALIGTLSYMCGSICYQPREKQKSQIPKEKIHNIVFILLTFLAFVVFFLTMNKQAFTKSYNSVEIGSLYLILLLLTLICVSVITEMYNLSVKNHRSVFSCINHTNPLLLLLTVIFIVIFYYIGSRTMPLQICLMIGCLYGLLMKPIGWKKFAFICLAGVMFMSVLVVLRVNREANTNKILEENTTHFFDPAMDIVITNRSLYVAVDYVHEHNVTFGKIMLANLMSPIPILQSTVIKLFNVKQSDLSSSEFFTVMQLGENYSVGLGTTIMADVYLAFGLPGVLFLMFILGFFVAKHMNKALSGNLYSLAIYAVMASYSVYLVRAEYFFPLRLLVWTLCCIYIMKALPITLKSKK
jgi:oligosaccharide repeat unit polymerase